MSLLHDKCVSHTVTSFKKLCSPIPVYCNINEYPKQAVSSRSQKPIALVCFYHWYGETHFPKLHPEDGRANILRNIDTNLVDNTATLPEGCCTLKTGINIFLRKL
jgi:hypothetical protein